MLPKESYVPTRLGYWTEQCPPQTAIQQADNEIDAAIDCIGEALFKAPGEIEKLVQEHADKAREALVKLRASLKELDPQWCEDCGGRWDDDPYHKAYCQPQDYSNDEHDIQREAILAGAVVAGAPAPGPRPEGD